ncbi:hypothetical protein [Paenibacillus eucommiae]|uniref:DUF1292 domain-containing protein n=1 Tax=Paenibacillus eucommiae TaxID=1355755 RepID=A0ABS4IRB5_9BACL|nr:hypothetical protein [Paenibacillus eucommiae]MBP1990073.1 hypothetical protein [Paenibacillus eucommiae]
MNYTILDARMTYSKEDGYVGHVSFQIENHKHDYEITLHSKYGREWMYALNFLNESGSEEDILAAEAEIDENDEWFDAFVEAAKSKLIKE